MAKPAKIAKNYQVDLFANFVSFAGFAIRRGSRC